MVGHCGAVATHIPSYLAPNLPVQVEALLREISASSAGGPELGNAGEANGGRGAGRQRNAPVMNGCGSHDAAHSSDSGGGHTGGEGGGASGGDSSGGSKADGIGNRPLQPLRGGSGGDKPKDEDKGDDKVGRQDGDGGGADEKDGRRRRSGDDDEQSVVGSTTGPSGGRRHSNPNLPDEVVQEVQRS